MQLYLNSSYGNVVLDNVKTAFRDEDNIFDQMYK